MKTYMPEGCTCPCHQEKERCEQCCDYRGDELINPLSAKDVIKAVRASVREYARTHRYYAPDLYEFVEYQRQEAVKIMHKYNYELLNRALTAEAEAKE